MRLWILKCPEAPWGDYGDYLYNGMAERDPQTKTLDLERTGPFVPPVTFPPFHLVFTDEVRLNFANANFTGFRFVPVNKKKVVRLDWQLWDKNSEEPQVYPIRGEPEGYTTEGEHSDMVASEMPQLWEISVDIVPGLQLQGNVINHLKYSGQDICRGNEFGHIFVTEKVKHWFEANSPQWVCFSKEAVWPSQE